MFPFSRLMGQDRCSSVIRSHQAKPLLVLDNIAVPTTMVQSTLPRNVRQILVHGLPLPRDDMSGRLSQQAPCTDTAKTPRPGYWRRRRMQDPDNLQANVIAATTTRRFFRIA
jgi:hypothetical protein